jgi:hypothetical protein
LGSLMADCWILEIKNKMAQSWRPSTCHGVGWWCVSVSTAPQPFWRLTNSFQSIWIYFNHFDLFQSFWSILIILIYFDHFDLFRSISILASKSPNYFDCAPTISICFDTRSKSPK